MVHSKSGNIVAHIVGRKLEDTGSPLLVEELRGRSMSVDIVEHILVYIAEGMIVVQLGLVARMISLAC